MKVVGDAVRRGAGLSRAGLFSGAAALLVFAGGVLADPPARADARGQDGKGQDATSEDFQFARRLSRVFRSVADSCEPAVVHITQLRQVQNTTWWGQPVGQPRIVPAGVGSGVIVDADGYVVTNNHVIEGAKQLTVKMSDGHEYPGTLVGADPQNDLAVVRIDTKGEKVRFSALPFANSDEIEVGEWVVAIGSPFGLDNSVTQGIVSAKGRTVTPGAGGISYEDYIQTDAAINPGNSGGPLLNLEGQVVGINSAIASRSGGYDGLGFAIPANVAKGIYDNIRANGRLVRGWLGVQWDKSRGDENEIVVQSIVEGSPAEAAGFKEGDVITKVQGQQATQVRFARALAVAGPGSKVDFEVQRDGKPRMLTATLADMKDYKKQIAKTLGMTPVEELGVSVKELDAATARRLGYGQRVRGVLVMEVAPDGRAADRLREGDVIVAVDDQTVNTPEALADAVKDADFHRRVRVNVVREGMRGYVELGDE
ncbi:MAG: trypsin-like peptidase domain-containing protein [Phycisphaerales bacterium]